VDGYGEWLEESSCVKGDVVWNSGPLSQWTFSLRSEEELLMAPYGRVVDSLLESSLEMGNALRATPELHLLAEVVTPLSTDGTLAAGNTNFEGNSVTNGEAIDLRSNAHYDTGRFMSKR
jgi:hypothetical protein